MEALKRLNVSIDRKWIVRDEMKTISLSLNWQLPDYDPTEFDSDLRPHLGLINTDHDNVRSIRLGSTLLPDSQGKIEGIFQVAESEIKHTKIYFDFGRGTKAVLHLHDFVSYFSKDPEAPNKASHSSPDRAESK